MKKPIALALSTVFAAAAMMASSSAVAMPSYISKSATWNQGSSPTPLANSGSNFCYLTRVSGRFAGDGEWAQVWDDGTKNSWFVGGTSQQAGVTASANCLPFATFKTEKGGVNSWTNSFYVNTGTIGGPSCDELGRLDPVTGNVTTSAWQGDAALTISGIIGEFNGGGETVTAFQGSSPSAPNLLNVMAMSYNGAGGWGQTLFVGVPQSRFNPAFYGPFAGPASASAAGAFSVSASATSGTQRAVLAPTNKAFCFFSEIGGAFGGGGEYVQIAPATLGGVEYWVLEVGSQQPNGTLASARCYALDQSVSM